MFGTVQEVMTRAVSRASSDRETTPGGKALDGTARTEETATETMTASEENNILKTGE